MRQLLDEAGGRYDVASDPRPFYADEPEGDEPVAGRQEYPTETDGPQEATERDRVGVCRMNDQEQWREDVIDVAQDIDAYMGDYTHRGTKYESPAWDLPTSLRRYLDRLHDILEREPIEPVQEAMEEHDPPTDEPVSREGEPTWMDKGIGALDMNAEWALGWLTRQAGLVMRDDPSEAWRAGWCDADQLANSEGEETLKAMTSVPLPPKSHRPTHADARSDEEPSQRAKNYHRVIQQVADDFGESSYDPAMKRAHLRKAITHIESQPATNSESLMFQRAIGDLAVLVSCHLSDRHENEGEG